MDAPIADLDQKQVDLLLSNQEYTIPIKEGIVIRASIVSLEEGGRGYGDLPSSDPSASGGGN
jgi:hypothetical protein